MSKVYFSKLMNAVAASRRGATAIEYGLLAALVATAVVAGTGTLGSALETSFTATGGDLKAAN